MKECVKSCIKTSSGWLWTWVPGWDSRVQSSCPDQQASPNPFLSGSADLFSAADGLLPVLILSFCISLTGCREMDD